MEKIFNPAKLEKLNNPIRLEEVPPNLIAQKISIENPSVIIDFGAGTALFSREFSKIYSNTKIYACDISQVMLDWITNNVIADYKNITPIKTDGESIPLEDNSSDAIIMINLYHELDEHLQIVKESYRVLKNGGKIVISDWRKIETENGPPFEIRVSEKDVKKHLLECGFKNIEITNSLKNNYLIVGEKIC
ncbi:class I SAM-dependent methyltransferase [bacterium]|nr:class I SAM-dependent methyltransferase [bacterium]